MGSSSRASGAMAGDAGDMSAPNTGELEFQNARWLSVLQECVLCLPKTMHVCVYADGLFRVAVHAHARRLVFLFVVFVVVKVIALEKGVGED